MLELCALLLLLLVLIQCLFITLSCAPMQTEMPAIEEGNSKRPVIINNKVEDEQPSCKALKANTIIFDGVRKSDVDKCHYRVITLPNQLQVLLIHEDGLDKASAAVDVHVGSFSDPESIPGVAHFLEHLLFMGTEKYPVENDYMEFLAAHGGNSNAFTDDEHTNYFFEVSAEHFEPALDRFAQFFVAPLFNPDGTSREMQAVDSEHKKNLKDDVWRIHQLERSLSRPDHPYSKFGTGCAESLNKPGIRDVVIEFYKQHYSANIMKAVLYGKDSLEQLAQWAEEKFSMIPNKSFTIPTYPDRPWTHIKKLINIKAIKEMQTLYVSWQTGDIRTHNLTKPDIYFSHLFGHEGRGSLLSFLKRKNLVLGLSAGFDENFHGFSFFQISFELTPVGRESVNEIIEACYQYIALLKKCGHQKWIHEECAALNEMSFRFKDKSQSSSSHAYKLASQMQEYPLERIISGPFLIEQWDPELIHNIINDFNVENFRAMLIYSGFKPDSSWSKEQWYGTVYKIQDLDESMLKRCSQFSKDDNPELQLPQANNFIPSKFDFVGELAQDEPKRQPDQIKPCLWFKQDDQFGLPKSSYHVLFKTPMVFESPLASASAGLYVECLKMALAEITYDATLAGLSFEIQSVADGFEVRVSGFSEKAPVLLETIAKHLVSFELDAATFLSVKDRFVRHLKSMKEEKPIWHAGYYAGCILQEKMLHWKDKLAAVETADQRSIFEFGQKAVKSCTLLVLVDGNETKDGVMMMIEKRLLDVVQPLNQFPNHTTVRGVKVPLGEHVFYDIEPVANPNSAIDFYLQAGTLDQAKTRQSVQLFAQIFSEQFFDQLRTKEQLGYMVYQQVREKGISIGLRMAVQSERDPVYLENRIELFLSNVIDKLTCMSNEEFNQYKQSLISDLTAKKKKLTQESKEFWAQISGFRNDFEKPFVDAKGVAELSKEDLIQFARQFVVKDAPERRKLVVHIWSESKADLVKEAYSNRKVIKSIGEFVDDCCELLDVSYKLPQ